MYMDALTKQSREAQVVIGGAVLYLLISLFLNWQEVSIFGNTFGRSEWHGIGVIAGLLVVALLLWEAARLFEVKVQLGVATPGHVSFGLALALLVFTIVTFLSNNEARHWPAWVNLLLSIVIAVAAWMRAQAEGVQMPDMSGVRGSDSSSTGSAVDREPPASV
jgi:hypothetical protein